MDVANPGTGCRCKTPSREKGSLQSLQEWQTAAFGPSDRHICWSLPAVLIWNTELRFDCQHHHRGASQSHYTGWKNNTEQSDCKLLALYLWFSLIAFLLSSPLVFQCHSFSYFGDRVAARTGNQLGILNWGHSNKMLQEISSLQRISWDNTRKHGNLNGKVTVFFEVEEMFAQAAPYQLPSGLISIVDMNRVPSGWSAEAC